MVGSLVLANTYTSEGTISGVTTLSLPWKSRQVVIINDSSSINLTVQLGGGSTMTLKPTETVSINIIINSATLTPASGSVAYRFWAYG